MQWTREPINCLLREFISVAFIYVFFFFFTAADMFILVINVLLLATNFGAAIRADHGPGEVYVLGSEPRASLLTDRDTNIKKCRYSHPYSMVQAKCTDLGLSEIPKNLRTDIQVRTFLVFREFGEWMFVNEKTKIDTDIWTFWINQ